MLFFYSRLFKIKEGGKMILTYETRRWPYKAIAFLSLPVVFWVRVKALIHKTFGINHDKATNLFFVDGLGKTMRKIKEGAASWRALDLVYGHEFYQNNTISGKVDDFWIGMMNAQAVRNRAKLAKFHLKEAILSFKDEECITMVSLACGSAKQVIETLAELKAGGMTNVRVILIDIEQEALDYAKKLALKHGVLDQLVFQQGNILRIKKYLKPYSPHIVEMMGFLDYLDEKQGARVANTIRESLAPNGKFLTCNIRPNAEMYFMRWVMNWWMIYREPEDLAGVISAGGFKKFTLHYEPLLIHGIVVAEKERE